MKANFATIVGDEEANPLEKKENSTPVMSKFLKYFKSDPEPEEEKGFFAKCLNNCLDIFEVEKSYTIFFIVISVGTGLLCLSLIFLPLVLISPQKFVSLFSLGASVILLSFIFIYGTKDYCFQLFSSSRAFVSVLFIVSIFVGVYASFIKGFYLISLICAVFQLITLIVFTLSFIPGGQYGISMVWSMVLYPFTSIWNKITGGGKSNSSFLPS